MNQILCGRAKENVSLNIHLKANCLSFIWYGVGAFPDNEVQMESPQSGSILKQNTSMVLIMMASSYNCDWKIRTVK